MNDTKKAEEKPILLSELLKLVEKCEGIYRQKRVYMRVVGLVMAELFAFGRHTITQLLLVLGITDDDWSAWYRLFSKGRFDEEQTSAVMLKEMLSEVAAPAPFVVGVDGFPVPRCSQTMPGTGWMRGLRTAKFKPGIQRGQRFVEGSWLTPMANGFSRAIPLRGLTAFTAKAVASAADPRTEVQAAPSGLPAFLQWVRTEMDKACRREQRLLSLHDGSYDTLDFWAALPARTVAVVRTAIVNMAPKQWLKDRKGFHLEVMVRGSLRRMRYRVERPFVRDGLPDVPLFLIVVGGGQRPPGSRRKAYDPCFFLVSAVLSEGIWSLPLPVTQLLAWLWQRWELEVAHRQLKSGLGLGEQQCWNAKATIATVQWSLWVYSLMMLAGYRAWGNDGGARPPGRWRSAPKRWSFNTLWRAFRVELWQPPDFRATWTRSRSNWLANEPLWDNLFNRVVPN